MQLAHQPRPASYGIEFVAQALADSPINIMDGEEVCRLAMLEAFGVVPQVEDWVLVWTMAMILRRMQSGGIA